MVSCAAKSGLLFGLLLFVGLTNAVPLTQWYTPGNASLITPALSSSTVITCMYTFDEPAVNFYAAITLTLPCTGVTTSSCMGTILASTAIGNASTTILNHYINPEYSARYFFTQAYKTTPKSTLGYIQLLFTEIQYSDRIRLHCSASDARASVASNQLEIVPV